MPRGSLEWLVTDVSFGSLSIGIEPKSRVTDADYRSRVVESFVDGLVQIQREGTTPPFFSDYGLRKARGLARALDKDGARAVRVRDIQRETEAEITPDVSSKLSQLVNVRYKEIGSVEGRLEVISVHRQPRFTVYDAITQRAVRCRFESHLLEVVKRALGRRVIVSGIVHLNYIGEPVRVDLENLQIVPEEQELPRPREMRGMSPDFTGDKQTEEYLRSIRDV